MQVVWIERLLLAAGCGGLIGYERTRRLKNAGIRTHVIVAIGAGMEGLGLTAAVLILLVQYLLRENTIFKFLLRQKHFHCRLVLENKGQSLASIRQLLEQAGFRRQSMTISSITPERIILIIDAQLTAQENIDLLLLTLSQQAMVLQVKREDWQN